MRNQKPFAKSNDLFVGDSPQDVPNIPFDDYVEPTEWSVITALNRVVDLAYESSLSPEFWERCKNPLAYLRQRLGLTDIQIIIIAILVESGDTMSWRNFGKYLHCTRLSIMCYSDDIEDLVEKRWIYRSKTREIGRSAEGFVLAKGVVTALRHNKEFVPEKIDGLTIQELLDKIERHVDKNMDDHTVEFEDDEKWMVQLCKANPQLPLCQEVMRFEEDLHVQSLLLMVVYDYAQWADSEEEGLSMSSIDNLYPDEYETNHMRHRLLDGTHVLIRSGYIEHKCADGMADPERYMLTQKSRELLLKDYTPSKSKCLRRLSMSRELKNHSIIKQKSMFYNAEEQQQIDRLTSLLDQTNLPAIQSRLEQEGMRKGFACLFYGAPGTGKTETVLQIARQTGRDIMQIDIAGMRNKYVGESEKNIKAVFARYRDICRRSEIMPILFFNEADAIFGKRTTVEGNNPSVEKMENAMQNIILQEMEDLDGILIATTNLTCNLDAAFERRFIFKVEFRKPDSEVRGKLWKSMLGENISDNDACRLAHRYDFSGGQIENIARKRTIEYILSGKNLCFEELDELCKNEMLTKKSERPRIGF